MPNAHAIKWSNAWFGKEVCSPAMLLGKLAMDSPFLRPPSVMRQQKNPATNTKCATPICTYPCTYCSARGYGTPQEHAILLCNLFLGLGMNAFVATGYRNGIERIEWVVVIKKVKVVPNRGDGTDHKKGFVQVYPSEIRELEVIISIYVCSNPQKPHFRPHMQTKSVSSTRP